VPTPPTLCVLVVDDQADVADAVADLLSALGCTVHTAYSGSQALAVARTEALDVAVVDINMPTMNGYETARRLHDGAPGLRIVGYTGSAVRPMTRLDAGDHLECLVSKGAPIELLIDAVYGRDVAD
jgi:CheY-like chemotaxis protein